MNCRPLGLILGVFCVICMTTTLCKFLRQSQKWAVQAIKHCSSNPGDLQIHSLKSDCLLVFVMWILGSSKWSVSLPTTVSGQPITISAYRGLWKQCYGSGGTGNSFQVSFQATSIGVGDKIMYRFRWQVWDVDNHHKIRNLKVVQHHGFNSDNNLRNFII